MVEGKGKEKEVLPLPPPPPPPPPPKKKEQQPPPAEEEVTEELEAAVDAPIKRSRPRKKSCRAYRRGCGRRGRGYGLGPGRR